MKLRISKILGPNLVHATDTQLPLKKIWLHTVTKASLAVVPMSRAKAKVKSNFVVNPVRKS
jgi:hypothetical protein